MVNIFDVQDWVSRVFLAYLTISLCLGPSSSMVGLLLLALLHSSQAQSLRSCQGQSAFPGPEEFLITPLPYVHE